MAGDIGIQERAIVLPREGQTDAARSIDRAARAIMDRHGRPMHFYGPRVLIAEIPPDAEDEIRTVEVLAVGEKATSIPTEMRSDLGEDALLGLQAFDLRQSKKYLDAKAERPHAEEDWDTQGALPPDAEDVGIDHGNDLSAMAQAGAPTSSRLTGSVAVGIIIVEGPNANLKFSATERVKVIAEVQNGLGWLGSYSSPAAVSWHYDIRIVTLNVQPGSSSLSLAQKEALWRDPAMAQLGYGPGIAGVQSYVNNLRSQKNTNWAYCAFFTKYPVGHFAYASIGGPRLVMDYANDGWGPDNIDRVFAHETGHIFGAPDEYASSGCGCGGQWGHYKLPNGNCQNCSSNSVDCIMKSNSWAMCAYTPYHLGFPQEQRYSGVWRQKTGSYGLWVNSSWSSFVNKWQQWSSQGLRLTDFEISRIGSSNRYSGVFEQGSGGYGLWVNASWTSFVNKWAEWNAQGLRLIDLEVTRIGDQLRYSGVFRQGRGAYGLWVNASWSSFISKWQQWSGQGLRLVDFETTLVNGETRYSGVFQQGTGAYGLWVNASWSSFIDKWNTWSRQGLRLTDFEINRAGGQARYSGVFNAGTGGYALWANANWTSFFEQWKTLAAQGLRLIDFEVFDATVPEGAAIAAGALDEGAGMGVIRLGEQIVASEEEGTGEVFFEEAAAAEDGIGIGQSVLEEELAEDGFGFESVTTQPTAGEGAARGIEVTRTVVERDAGGFGGLGKLHDGGHREEEAAPEGAGFAVGV